MRNLSPETLTAFAGPVTTTCLCWRLSRTYDATIGVTDHDRALSFDGITYEPGGALGEAEFASSAAMKPGHASATGALSSEAISEADLAAGLWNGARVDVWRVDWSNTAARAHIWSGRFTSITHGALGFTAELVSLKADLERPVGRVFSRGCDAVLGDARCSVDTSDPAHAGKACDQRAETCRAVFNNIENYRGFPHMPGADFLLAGPAANGKDGGKR